MRRTVRTTVLGFVITALITSIGSIYALYPDELHPYRFPILIISLAIIFAGLVVALVRQRNEETPVATIGMAHVLLYPALPLEIVLLYFAAVAQSDFPRTFLFWSGVLLGIAFCVHLAVIASRWLRPTRFLYAIARPRILAAVLAALQIQFLFFAFQTYRFVLPRTYEFPVLLAGTILMDVVLLRRRGRRPETLLGFLRETNHPFLDAFEGVAFVIGVGLTMTPFLFDRAALPLPLCGASC